MTAFLRRLADSRSPRSAASRYRQRRYEILRALLAKLPRPATVLDVGGTVDFWERAGLLTDRDLDVTLLNLFEQSSELPNLRAVIGSADDLTTFGDNSFDVVVSNSVIEHLPTFELQRRMANEVRRVGRRLFIQTPNRGFPIEPHFLFPWFQFLPIRVRVALLRRVSLGWFARQPDAELARASVTSIRLLTEGELRQLFPGARLISERLLGMTKSSIVVDGWAGPTR